MKIKTRIIGIGLALMLIVSVVAMAIPASAGPPGDTQWLKQSVPTTAAYPIYSGSEGTDFAQSQSGRVYIVDSAKNVLKTGTTGTVWSSLGNNPAANPTHVAVAVDNDQSIAVADATASLTYISTDGGVNWSTLPALPVAGQIMDLAVGPTRAGLLLGREYAVALADATANSTALGGVYVIGATATWTAVATTAGAADFFHVQFSPGYVGDRILVAGSAANATGVIGYWLLNSSTNLALTGYGPATVVTAGAAADLGATAPIASLDIALPSDFDPTATPVAYVGVGLATANASINEVWRMSGSTAVDLAAVTTQAVDSVGYAGTQSEGTLFVGYVAAGLAKVKRTTNPTASAPTWVSTLNNPTGSTFCNVKPNVDYASSNRVNAFTRGAESAWSISEDGGVSFYQRSWIDNGNSSDWIAIEDMAITTDGSEMYVLTDDAKVHMKGTTQGTGNVTLVGDLHVWKQTVPPSSMSAKRMYTIVGSGDGTISTTTNSGWAVPVTTTANQSWLRLNPDWGTSPSIYVVDLSTNPDTIHVSHNAGATWTTRFTPVNNIDTFVVVDKDTLYATNGNLFYKSTNAAWTWESGVAWNTSGTAVDMNVTADGTIFISYSGVRKSTNGGASWASVGSYGNPTGNEWVLADTNFADNGIVYLANQTTGVAYRLDVATNTYRSMANPAFTGNTSLGMKIVDDVLYVISPDGVERIISPATATLSAASWSVLDQGSAGLIRAGTTSNWAMDGTTIYVDGADTAGTENEDLFGYIDSAAAGVPVISSPASGTEIGVDPVNGRGIPFTIVIDALGDAQGKINRWDYKVWDKAAGKATAVTIDTQTGSSKLTSALTDGTDTWPIMLSNTTYVFQVRGAQATSGEVLDTKWSDTVEVTVQSGTMVTQTQAGPQVLGPQGGGTTGLNPGFAWAPVSGATKYQFIVATDAALTNAIGGTPVEVSTPSYQVMDLDYGTTYFWGVKVLEPTPGTQTISTFATMDEPVAAVDPGTTAPVVTVPTQPVPDIIVNVPEQPAAGGAISDTAIWAVIGIGAVLIVAVLVLIVRTRRPV